MLAQIKNIFKQKKTYPNKGNLSNSILLNG
jgi:hypothetical protein